METKQELTTKNMQHYMRGYVYKSSVFKMQILSFMNIAI